VRERIALAAERSSRNADAVTLITVTKSVQVERIREAIAAGATHLGENRVQEAQAKFAKPGTQIADGIGMDNLTLHMIGSLQRNKAHDAAALFDWIHSTDSSQLLAALDKASQDTRAGKPLPVLLQANLTGEPTKSGVGAGALSTLAAALAGCQNLVGAGLMTIARLGADEIELHNTFAKLRRLLDELRATHPGDWQHLSMGMSNDYEIAIQEGATMVRLGRAIFGERK
jgi:pyridoxal phosphate enzyme (YggS family)